MSSSVCQGLQPCREPWLMEPHLLMNRLVPSTSTYSQSTLWPLRPKPLATQKQNEKLRDEKNHNISINNASHDSDGKSKGNGELGGKCFLQTLALTSHSTNNCKEGHETEKEVYVPPFIKRSYSILSSKSMEMCTESLGSENGSDLGDSSIEFSPQISSQRRTSPGQLPNKITRRGPYPPPLTSMCSSDGVPVMRPHREGGRLVLEAVTVSTCNAYFQAERVDGCLRLHLVNYGNEEVCKDEDVWEEANEDQEEEEEAVFDDENNLLVGDSCEDMEGNDVKVGSEMGIGELPRPRTCKEGGNGNNGKPTWGPFWVAIS